MTHPAQSPFRAARLLTDEQRLRGWYLSLEWSAQDDWYTLHELRAATGIPLARLPTVLWRCGWSRERRRDLGITAWHGPHGSEAQ
jgi:hypothetical protein